jgi:hypothetical protein
VIRFTGVQKYTVAQLEQRAEFLLTQRCGWPPDLPVDIASLVDREPGMLLDILPGLQRVAAVAGFVRYEPHLKNLRLIIDADVADHPAASFYRFTVAEEFAHILLHRQVMEQVGTLEDLQSLHEWSGYEAIDWNAKRLAAALLMPTIPVAREARTLYPKLVDRFGFARPAELAAKMQERLARLHCVSVQAMRKRLKEWPRRTAQKVEQAMRDRITFLQ